MIIFERTMPNGATCQYHKALRFEIHEDATHAIVNSYHAQDMEMISWQDTYTIPIIFQINNLEDVETILVAATDSPFTGGTIVPNETATLDGSKARFWARIKTEREVRLNGTVQTDYGPLQCSEDSLSRLAGSSVLLDTPDTPVMWTMADNTEIAVTAEMISSALRDARVFINDLHNYSQQLRTQSEQATTEDELAAIVVQWPHDPVPEITPDIPNTLPFIEGDGKLDNPQLM